MTIEILLLDTAGNALPGVELELSGEWGVFAFRRGARVTSDARGIARIHAPAGGSVSVTAAPRTDRWQKLDVYPAPPKSGMRGGTFEVARHWHSGIEVLQQSFSGDARSVAASCFLLRAVQHRHRVEAAACLERLRPLLTDPVAIAECEESLASLRE